MRKTVLLPGLCLLLCTSVRGIQEGDVDGDSTEEDHPYDYYNNYDQYSTQPPWYYFPDELPDPEEEKILDLQVLKTLVEDVQEAARAIASETASDPKRIKFGKLGHLIKPIKFLSWLHKPHKASSTDVSIDIDAEIVVPPPAQSSENEE